MELGSGSLQNALDDRRYSIEVKDVRKLLAKLISAGAYMQSKKLVHRDIKPANIILYGQQMDVKIADFGLSCHCAQRPFGYNGTPDYSSPILQEYYRSGCTWRPPLSDAFKDDVYSLGLTIRDVIHIKRLNNPREMGHDFHRHFRFVLEEMLQKDERDRPTFQDLTMS